ncbi:tyrosine-protein phosphatase [Sphingobacterium sp. LRF_L2]|uniref:tyrosine-protein phosphatase n=1 Tax=Sphingobacterium sp. LRF_L2 TaxID=3369421 RepID=UPI003F602288
MFSIFSRKIKFKDLSWMRVDMHSHILPGLDDGSASLNESIDMVSRLYDQGLVQIYGTPHIQGDKYPNDRMRIESAFLKLHDSAKVAHMLLDYAAEYTVDEKLITLIEEEPESLLCLPNKHVLLGMSFLRESPLIEKAIKSLKDSGYTPILGNPERYVYYQDQLHKLIRFKDMGCLLQVSLLSCYGYYGSKERQMVRSLLDKGMVDLIGTNIHYGRHMKAIEHYVRKEDLSTCFLGKIRNEELFLNKSNVRALFA